MNRFGCLIGLPSPQAWQVLPLVPPETDYWSPYTGLDALCGNPMLIDIEDLITRGLLDPEDRPAKARPRPYRVRVCRLSG